MEAAMVRADQIREDMEIVGNDGEHVGIVDGIDPDGEIKISRSDTPDRLHHFLPMATVALPTPLGLIPRRAASLRSSARGRNRYIAGKNRWCRRRDLNPRPPAYEADALPLSYAGLSWATDIGAHCAWQAISETACAGAASRPWPALLSFPPLDRSRDRHPVRDRRVYGPKE